MPRVLKADLEKEIVRLKREIAQWEQQCQSLQDDVDYWIEQNDQKAEELHAFYQDEDISHIRDLENFKHFLRSHKGYDDNDYLFEYIDEYMRYYND